MLAWYACCSALAPFHHCGAIILGVVCQRGRVLTRLQDADVGTRYLVLASTAALLSYVEHVQNVHLLSKGIRVVWREAEGRMVCHARHGALLAVDL